MNKQAITLTTNAQTHILEILRDNQNKALLLGLNSKGCSGHSYTFDLIDETAIGKFDDVLDLQGHKVVVAASSLLNLLGSTLDYKQDNFGSHFVWDNPNVQVTCGCGESVGFKQC